MLCVIIILISLQKIRRLPSKSRDLWPKNAHADSLPGGGPDFLTKCADYNGKFNGEYGPIDPSKPENFKIIGELIKEVRQVFNDSYIHLGGDEVDAKCWGSNKDLQKWMAENNLRWVNFELGRVEIGVKVAKVVI